MTSPLPTVDELCAFGAQLGLDAVGVCDASVLDVALAHITDRKERGLHGGMWFTYGRPERSTDPGRIVAGARSIVVAALRCHNGDATPLGSVAAAPEGRVARYVHEPFYDRLGAALERLAEPLRAAGHEAVVVLDDNRLVDRAVAHRAGLGWFGKNTMMLLNDRDGEVLGSWFVLGSIVSTASLDATPPTGPTTTNDGCGPCVRCQAACPTGALDVAGELDARKCLAWLVQADGVFPVEHRVALGARLYGCDECQEVCPPNVRFLRRRPGAGAAGTTASTVDLVELLDASNNELMERFGRWYIPRRQPDYLRRNALVVLANIVTRVDSDIERVLARSLAWPDPMVVAHAVWAARRLGRDDLLDHILADVVDDPAVVAELDRRVNR